MSRSDDPDVAGFDDRSSATESFGAASASRSPSDQTLGSFTYPDVDDEPNEPNGPVRGRHAQPTKRRRIPLAPVLVAGALALGLIVGGVVWLQPGPDGEEVAADSPAEDDENPFSGGAAGPPLSSPSADEDESTPEADDADGDTTSDEDDAAGNVDDGDTSNSGGQSSTNSASSGDGQSGSGGDGGGGSTSPTPEDDVDSPETEAPGESNERVGERPPQPGEREDEEGDEDEDDGCPRWICWW
ncbi:hypothetical protein J4H86_17655 [Spiractinospora alimapuensis]|uniref:hypothetical protein n=1 Tax=Spiractinospora alimapuensis TaxID=2820884 RepID=UPI001F464985|nr:hypothetical protein [Spiractinospora alimapuensis]QVQ50704.1 hypothetical protein J4H86_17655 [Spiractinospora alimapuensis]